MKKVEKSNWKIHKLEEKLNELGYWKYTDFIYVKFMRNLEHLEVDLEINISNLTGRLKIGTNTEYYFIKGANDFVQAFNQLQQDLEVLREYE